MRFPTLRPSWLVQLKSSASRHYPEINQSRSPLLLSELIDDQAELPYAHPARLNTDNDQDSIMPSVPQK